MNYRYGNSYKEALSNPAIEIDTIETLMDYSDIYTVLIPDDKFVELPVEIDMPIDSCLADAIEDTNYVEEVINNYLSDNYKYVFWNYDYEIKDEVIHITNINWDVED